jgi:hypothetical protein
MDSDPGPTFQFDASGAPDSYPDPTVQSSKTQVYLNGTSLVLVLARIFLGALRLYL